MTAAAVAPSPVLPDAVVVNIAVDALATVRAHKRNPDLCSGPGRCAACLKAAELYLLAQQVVPDLGGRIADARAERLARDGGGTDWEALGGTVFAR